MTLSALLVMILLAFLLVVRSNSEYHDLLSRPEQFVYNPSFDIQWKWNTLQDKFQLERTLQEAESELEGIVKCEFHALTEFKEMRLSDMACRMKDSTNAGGDSVESEVMSLELLHYCFGAKLLKTEMEVKYYPYGGSIVDYTCEIFGVSLGVSVTRAMKYKGEFEKKDAEKLLCKKLTGISNATQNALEKWSKQMLHVWATSANVADVLTSVYHDLSTQLKLNTIVLVTIVTTPQHSLFKNSRGPKPSLQAQTLL